MGIAPIYTLRDADMNDLEFLFGVMMVNRKSQVKWNAEFRSFKKNFFRTKTEVVLCKDRGAGWLQVVRSPTSMYVDGIYLLPAYQGRGIGSAVLSDLITESNSTCVPISLVVREDNEARHLYYRMGFVEAGERDSAEFINLIYIPAW